MLSRLRRVSSGVLIALLVGLIAVFSVAAPAGVEAKTTTLTGNNGTWKVATEGNATEGNKIHIEFTPDETKIKCDKIVFVQVCQVSIDGTVVPKQSYLTPKWDYQDDDMVGGGWLVDHIHCEADPYYNGDDKGKDIGQQGRAGSVTPARMFDAPRITPAGFAEAAKHGITGTVATIHFETAAYCADTGKFLGSINWKYTRGDRETAPGESELTSTEVNETPSNALKEALKKFEDNHHKANVITEIGPDGIPYIVEWWTERYCPDE